ncbi:hypothetical protein KP509_32G042600 [Ceratopteris richardii]|nr:hypothetical protein KP509_32G042600 [Ceratopteris richardii]
MSYLRNLEQGLLQFVEENKMVSEDVVRALMPSTEDVRIQGESETTRTWYEYEEGCKEGVVWAQWLMFGGDPKIRLKDLQQETGHVRGVCGAIWGSDDLAYRCRTCENDPTCAICVACFEPAKHINHDYSMIHTGGGCCDCGDITAWNESGFCSRHSGTIQAPFFPEDIGPNFELVMETLLSEWGNKLRRAASFPDELLERQSNYITRKVAILTSLPMIGMLLSFCNCSEPLMICSGDLIASEKLGLIGLFLKSEYFLSTEALDRLNELLFKLIGNPNFKRKFAETFIHYYPQFVQDELRQISGSINGDITRMHASLNNFPVQVFTVPTLTPHLVVDLKLLDMLLDTLKEAFISCSKGDPHQLIDSRQGPMHVYKRVVNDIQLVIRHTEVADYIAQERLDLLKSWIHLLSFAQTMDSQKRQTNSHTEEESESWITAFTLEALIAELHTLFIAATAKVNFVPFLEEASNRRWDIDEDATHVHAKIGRTSAGSDVSGKIGTSNMIVPMDDEKGSISLQSRGFSSCFGYDELTDTLPVAPCVPALLLWLISECSKVFITWFFIDEYRKSSRSSRLTVRLGGRTVHRNNVFPSRSRGKANSRRFDGSSAVEVASNLLSVTSIYLMSHGTSFKDSSLVCSNSGRHVAQKWRLCPSCM